MNDIATVMVAMITDEPSDLLLLFLLLAFSLCIFLQAELHVMGAFISSGPIPVRN